MSLFDGQDLFSSGPHRFEAGGLELRHAMHESPGSDGVAVSGQGRNGRAITQTGELVADSSAALRTLAEAIEARLDGLPHNLVDDNDRIWSDTVMLLFDARSTQRLGRRWKLSYRIEYLQVTP